MPIWTPNDELFHVQKIPSRKKQRQCMISGFCCKADENCALLGYYAEVSNFLPPFWKNLSVPSCFFTAEEGTNRLFQNVGKNYHYSLCNDPEKRSSQCFVTIPQSAVHNYLLYYLGFIVVITTKTMEET